MNSKKSLYYSTSSKFRIRTLLTLNWKGVNFWSARRPTWSARPLPTSCSRPWALLGMKFWSNTKTTSFLSNSKDMLPTSSPDSRSHLKLELNRFKKDPRESTTKRTFLKLKILKSMASSPTSLARIRIARTLLKAWSRWLMKSNYLGKFKRTSLLNVDVLLRIRLRSWCAGVLWKENRRRLRSPRLSWPRSSRSLSLPNLSFYPLTLSPLI